jgi:hypothetical protein
MRVYGALMWSLGKVLNTPEVARVYIGYVTLYMHVSVKMFSLTWRVGKETNVFLQSLVILSLSLFSIMKLHQCHFCGGIVADIFISPFFCSSFNDKPVNDAVSGPIGKELFEKEQEDLLSDLKDIPKAACDRRVSLII